MTLEQKVAGIVVGINKKIKNEIFRLNSMRQNRKKKDDDSFVTEGDYMVNNLIFREFNRKLSDHEIMLISEETEHAHNIWSRAQLGELVIVIDPIDGTENFTSGLPEWGVAISIYKAIDDESVRQPTNILEHVYSAIMLPEMDRFMDSTMRDLNVFDSRIKGLSSSLSKEALMEVEEGFEYRIFGCSVYNLYNVIQGSYHSYENVRGVHSWDLLAGINIAIKNGLKVEINHKEYNGEFLPTNQKYRVKITRS